MKRVFVFLLAAVLFFPACAQDEDEKISVLVFSKTVGFRHSSIPNGVKCMIELGMEHGWSVTSTEDASLFTDDFLKNFDVVVFNNTTQDIFNEEQQEAFKRYYTSGKGFVAIHAAADTEYDWEWYGKMVGGYFKSHPRQQNAKVNIINKDHASTNMLPDEIKRRDEWYDFKNINPDIIVLATLDETSYKGGKMNNNHPIVWYHEFEGGRIFYTGFGHTNETFDDPLIQKHILGGIKYAIGK